MLVIKLQVPVLMLLGISTKLSKVWLNRYKVKIH